MPNLWTFIVMVPVLPDAILSFILHHTTLQKVKVEVVMGGIVQGAGAHTVNMGNLVILEAPYSMLQHFFLHI
jgi:hypothetical protein